LSDIPASLQLITEHPFTKRSFQYGLGVTQEIETGSALSIRAELKREPDEYEFYILRVSHSLAHLLTVCEQLHHAVLYLSAFTPTKRMRNFGISRYTNLHYNIENYLIRTQTVYDRLLVLVDAVFHLANDPQYISHESILSNLHVKRTGILDKMRKLRKLLRKYQYKRNTIIHHESYQEEDLRKLEMYHVLQRTSTNSEDDARINHLSRNLERVLTREYVKSKMQEFDEFNDKIFYKIKDVFDDLRVEYDSRLKYIALKCGHKHEVE
jgi:hypothetical protein